jgi:hypothetical protein
VLERSRAPNPSLRPQRRRLPSPLPLVLVKFPPLPWRHRITVLPEAPLGSTRLLLRIMRRRGVVVLRVVPRHALLDEVLADVDPVDEDSPDRAVVAVLAVVLDLDDLAEDQSRLASYPSTLFRA